ncbi:MAG: hypothetical protein GF384_00180, partial [Elusimicrobia bacterium]|nr:hypothetical protein [Elusimicrobiota bacterium]MBD3411513.1 hypothetical protein [Elusimicrobiota bacterium]
MQKKPFVERRKYIRFMIDARVNFEVEGKAISENNERKVPGLIKNLCFEGACLILDEQFPPGHILKLELFLPSISEPIHVQSEVRWSRPYMNQDVNSMYETGVKIININPKDQAVFIDFIREKLLQAMSK